MPRAFLVKKVNITNAKKNWSQPTDSVRGDIYNIPLSIFPSYVNEVSEGSLAEHSSFTTPRKSNPFLQIPTQVLSAQLPSTTAQGQHDQRPECRMRTQRLPYFRSKIKITTGNLPSVASIVSDNASKLASTPPDAYVLTCQVCQKVFSTARMLKRHAKCHSETKRFSCESCGKGFNDTFDLKRHVRTHTGVRPYKCSLCAKAFTQRCSLESHQKKIHAITQQYGYKERRDKVYVCEECGLTAPTQDSLWNHLQDEHPLSRLIVANTINCNEGKKLAENMNDNDS